mgnify:CR=1 FL=1
MPERFLGGGRSARCPADANGAQIDADGDGLGDACDPCPKDAWDDWDGDGVGDLCDNCPSDINSDQADFDFIAAVVGVVAVGVAA